MTKDSESGYLEVRRRGLMLVLSSPSGAGKTTLSRMLLDRDGGLDMSVSVTTRPKRPGEVSGVDYHFIDASEFNLRVNRRELLERAKVFGHYYGTPKAPVEAALAAGRDVLFDIDWQGTQQLARERARGSGQHLHPAAVDPRAGAPAAGPRPGQRRGGRPAHGQGGR